MIWQQWEQCEFVLHKSPYTVYPSAVVLYIFSRMSSLAERIQLKVQPQNKVAPCMTYHRCWFILSLISMCFETGNGRVRWRINSWNLSFLSTHGSFHPRWLYGKYAKWHSPWSTHVFFMALVSSLNVQVVRDDQGEMRSCYKLF